MCLGTLVQDGLAHMSGVIWRAVLAKFKTGMCEMKILGSEAFVVYLWNVGSGWVGTHAWCNMFRAAPAKFKTGMREMKILGSEGL